MWRLRKRISDEYNTRLMDLDETTDMLKHFSGFCDKICALQAPPHQSLLISTFYTALMARKLASRIYRTQDSFKEVLKCVMQCQLLLPEFRKSSVLETMRLRAFDRWKAARFLWASLHYLVGIPFKTSCFSNEDVNFITDHVLQLGLELRPLLLESAANLLEAFKGMTDPSVTKLTEGAVDPVIVRTSASGQLHELEAADPRTMYHKEIAIISSHSSELIRIEPPLMVVTISSKDQVTEKLVNSITTLNTSNYRVMIYFKDRANEEDYQKAMELAEIICIRTSPHESPVVVTPQDAILTVPEKYHIRHIKYHL